MRASTQGSSGNDASCRPDHRRRRPSPPVGGSLTGTCQGRACACGAPSGWAAETASFKLTQKVPAGRPGYVQGLITNTYLSAAEYDLLASLPGEVLSKTRLSVPPLGIDIFDPPLHGLVLAEAEFTTDQAAQSFLPPQAAVAEVTDDARFTGSSLARTRRHDLLAWLAEFGIKLQETE